MIGLLALVVVLQVLEAALVEPAALVTYGSTVLTTAAEAVVVPTVVVVTGALEAVDMVATVEAVAGKMVPMVTAVALVVPLLEVVAVAVTVWRSYATPDLQDPRQVEALSRKVVDTPITPFTHQEASQTKGPTCLNLHKWLTVA